MTVKGLNPYSERVGLLPGDGRSPCAEPHLVGQRLWDSQQDEADVGQSDESRHQHHQVIAVAGRQVRSDGRAGDQTRCERRRNLDADRNRTHLSSWVKDTESRSCRRNILKQLHWDLRLWNLSKMLFIFNKRASYESVRRAPLMLICNVCDVSEDYRESDGKRSGHWDHGKVPPENKKWNMRWI